MPPEWDNKLQDQSTGAWITIGSYDGVHLGHQKIIRELVEGSHEIGSTAVVINFFPHPLKILGNISGPFYLTTQEEKNKVLSNLGVDSTISIKFDLEFSKQSADIFIRLLHRQLQFSNLLIGYDFKFGADRGGDFHTLSKLGEELGYSVRAIERFEKDSQPISSSVIRQLIKEGNVKMASDFLGRPYAACGNIIHGDGRGRTIGLPTANLDIWPEKLLPVQGVYAAYAYIGSERSMSVVNIGNRPTFYQVPSHQTVEAHLLDFSGDIYGNEMRLDFIERIRPEKNFGNTQELMVQIKEDIQNAREVLAYEPGETNLSA